MAGTSAWRARTSTGTEWDGTATRARTSADWLLPLFAIAFAAAFLVPPFTPYVFKPDPLLRWGDVLDLATPVLMLPMYWLVLSHRRGPLPRWEMVAFLALGAVWIEGQSIHLAANAIGHQPASGAAREVTEFFDEKLGHILWHGAALGLAALIVWRRLEPGIVTGPPAWFAVIAAAAIYGFAFFLIAVEGATGILVAAGSVAIAGLALRRGPGALWSCPTASVFGSGHVLTLVLLGIWFVYWGGSLPEFSSLGLIK